MHTAFKADAEAGTGHRGQGGPGSLASARARFRPRQWLLRYAAWHRCGLHPGVGKARDTMASTAFTFVGFVEPTATMSGIDSFVCASDCGDVDMVTSKRPVPLCNGQGRKSSMIELYCVPRHRSCFLSRDVTGGVSGIVIASMEGNNSMWSQPGEGAT